MVHYGSTPPRTALCRSRGGVCAAAARQRSAHRRLCGAVLPQLRQRAVAAAGQAVRVGSGIGAAAAARGAAEDFLRRKSWRH